MIEVGALIMRVVDACVQCVLLSAGTMLIDGSLPFLGLGISPPTATRGTWSPTAGRTCRPTRPRVLLPGLTIAVFVLLINLAGTRLRALIDPRARMLFEQRRRQHSRRAGLS